MNLYRLLPRTLPVLLLASALPAHAQIVDDFTDGLANWTVQTTQQNLPVANEVIANPNGDALVEISASPHYPFAPPNHPPWTIITSNECGAVTDFDIAISFAGSIGMNGGDSYGFVFGWEDPDNYYTATIFPGFPGSALRVERVVNGLYDSNFLGGLFTNQNIGFDWVVGNDNATTLPDAMRLTRTGNTFELFVANDSTGWKTNFSVGAAGNGDNTWTDPTFPAVPTRVGFGERWNTFNDKSIGARFAMFACGSASIQAVLDSTEESLTDSVASLCPDGLVHDYQLDGDYLDALGGPALVPNGGMIDPSRYTFGVNQGLSLSGGFVNTGDYSIAMVMEYDGLSPYWKKIIDFEGLSEDFGLYIGNAQLRFYTLATGGGPASISANTDFCVVLTRDSATQVAKGYINGVLQWTSTDSSGQADASTNLLTFFEDDNDTGQFEAQSGSVDRIQIYDGALTDAEVASLGECLGWDEAPVDAPPIADAGADFPVNEGQLGVMLDGSGSSDPENDPLTYAWAQIGGTPAALSDPAAQQPTFDAPIVAIGGETLSFELTVSANGLDATDTVDVTVVNVNHPPVADAGEDQSIAEGSPVTLHGEDSFDVDNDSFTYSWVQVGGTPTVALTGAATANPIFSAPFVAAGGAPGVVATLVFELTVDDGYPQDAPAPGYTLANVVDSVTIEVTNLNNFPAAAAGSDQTVNENSFVSLSGALSSDPDGDTLTYAWAQTGGTGVTIADQFTATPSFTVPFVSAGGEDYTFELTVNDGFGGSATDSVVIHVQNINDPPLVSAAVPSIGTMWPPNHKLVPISILGVSDPEDNATITIDSVTQDEPTNGQGDGDTPVDAIINADGTVLLRAERAGGGNGRVYHIHFTASDLEGSASGVVTVSVPHKKKSTAVDDGELYDSTN